MVYLYDNGLPWVTGTEPETGKDILQANLDDMYDRVHKLGKASVIIVDGMVGEGKTTMAVNICQYLEAKSFDKEKDILLKEHFFMGYKEFVPGLEASKLNKKVIIYDEAGDYAKKSSNSKENKFLDGIFQRYRAYKVIIIMTLPCFYHLPNDLFDNGIARMLIHCHSRTLNNGEISVYDMKGMNAMRHYVSKYPATKQDCYKFWTPSFRGSWHNLPPYRDKELSNLGISGKSKLNTMANVKMQGWVTYKELMQITGKTQRYIRSKVNEMGIKEAAMINKAKYFTKEDAAMIKKSFKK